MDLQHVARRLADRPAATGETKDQPRTQVAPSP